jgi:hypothetical protein
MSGMLIAVMLVAAPAQQTSPPSHIEKYLQRCEGGRQTALAATQREIKALETQGESKPDTSGRLEVAREKLARLKSQPAPLATLPLPPEKDDLGVFKIVSVDGRRGRFVDVLEVIDKNSAVIRVWYRPGITPAKNGADKQEVTGKLKAAKDPVPLDFWAQGIDTTGMKDHSRAELPQVFHALGNKGLPTDCGTRSLMVLTPIDVERYRSGAGR